jgi:polyhydroxyalkanoate synthesis repressor PhaR
LNVAMHNNYAAVHMLVVKKYANRRLYDTAASRYITLEDLAALIRKGADVVVQDAHSGADLTQATLTQIILEMRGGARLLPVPLLVRLIRMGDEALAEFFGRYVSWALELYIQAKQGARTLLPLNPLATAPFAATDALARLVLGASPFNRDKGAAPAGAPEPPPPESEEDPLAAHAPPGMPSAAVIDQQSGYVPGRGDGVADEMARIRAELADLKRSLGGARAPRPKTAKKASKKKR